MIQAIISLMNKPKVFWTEFDHIMYYLYIIATIIIIIAVIIRIYVIASKINDIKKKHFKKQIERMRENIKGGDDGDKLS